jgi:hypothetical protein
MFVGHDHGGSSAEIGTHESYVGSELLGEATRDMAVLKNHSLAIGDRTRPYQIKIEPGHNALP